MLETTLPNHSMDTKPRLRVILPKAYCTNNWCITNNKTDLREVSRSKTFCPFCKHALFWSLGYKTPGYDPEKNKL